MTWTHGWTRGLESPCVCVPAHISQQEFVAGSDGCREKRWLLWAEHTQPLVLLLLLRSPGETAETALALVSPPPACSRPVCQGPQCPHVPCWCPHVLAAPGLWSGWGSGGCAADMCEHTRLSCVTPPQVPSGAGRGLIPSGRAQPGPHVGPGDAAALQGPSRWWQSPWSDSAFPRDTGVQRATTERMLSHCRGRARGAWQGTPPRGSC